MPHSIDIQDRHSFRRSKSRGPDIGSLMYGIALKIYRHIASMDK